MGRPAKYDWDDKKDICYQLYVEQKKSPPEIVRYFANHFNVPESEIPSARLFRHQFLDIWKFPKRIKRLSKEDEPLVVERIKQLWEQNLRVQEIRDALEDEGWHIRNIEFRRLRRKYDLLRRWATGAYGEIDDEEASASAASSSNKRKRDEEPQQQQVQANNAYGLNPGVGGMGGFDAGADALMALHSQQNYGQQSYGQQDYGLGAQTQAHNAQYLPQVQSEPAQPQRKRKKNAETRWNSETPLTECKDCLQLTNDMYMAIRSSFEQTCIEYGIERKKGALETGLWQQVKDKLVRENMHLSALMHPLQPDLDKKTIAVDVICCDVTKRMRVGKKLNLTLADANNMLGLNPRQSKDLRRQFYHILQRDGYTNRQECGEEHWQELRNEWFANSPVLTQALADGATEPLKLKSIDILCREAAKRYGDDKVKSDPSKKQPNPYSHLPGPARPKEKKTKPTKRVLPLKEPRPRGRPRKEDADPHLDPTLAALDDPIAVDFRLGHDSHIVGYHPRLWNGEMRQRSVQALHQAAKSRAGAANVTSVQGMIRNEDGTEGSHVVVANEDLEAYLNAAGEKPTFVVVLEGGYA